MNEVNDLLTWLSELIQDAANAGQPALVILVNVLILGLIAMYVVWRVKSELRGIQWNQLTFAQRREIIEKVLGEAIEMAEWLYSYTQPDDPAQKRKIAKQKKKAALQYAEHELAALGAAQQDTRTLKMRLEHVMADQNPGKIRFGARGMVRTRLE